MILIHANIPIASAILIALASAPTHLVNAFTSSPAFVSPIHKQLSLNIRHLYRDPDQAPTGIDPINTSNKSSADKSMDDAKDEDVKYAHVQGLSLKPEEACKSCIPDNISPETRKRLERILKPRPYPLFLAEKAAKIVGDTFHAAPPGESSSPTQTKEKVVILGTGWGAVGLLQDKQLTEKFDVTVISPRNHWLYTPMLAGSAVGTCEPRSITLPARELNLKANYLEATALAVDKEARTVTCQGVVCDDECLMEEFDVQYDRLIVSVGARTNTFGIKGVEEYCEFLKEVPQARSIRRKIVNCFERANYPGVSDDARRMLLTFAIIGAGPTGVEFASELRDFVEQDVPKYWPHLLPFVSIKLIGGSPTVLQPFDKNLQDAAIDALNRRFESKQLDAKVEYQLPESIIEIILDAFVDEVREDRIALSNGRDISYGVAIWAGGIGPHPITLDIIEGLGEDQVDCQGIARGKIAVDPYLRAIGGEGRIFAIGDCTCMRSECLPSNAQVASQQGEYLAHLLTHTDMTASYEGDALLPPRIEVPAMSDSIAALVMGEREYAPPFQFLDLGILAYTGSESALAQVKVGSGVKAPKVKIKGQLGFGVWRSVYLVKSPSMRTRFLLLLDWAKAKVFGRDITMIE